jgi:thymidylate synthase (FAD)
VTWEKIKHDKINMKVELVAKTTGVGKYSELDSEEIVAAIARHGIIKEDNGKLVKYLMDNKHVSPLDMINFVFEVQTSLSIGRQLLRHASIKPQEHSLRYSESVGFESIELRQEHKTNRQSSTEAFDPLIKITPTEIEGIAASELINRLLDDIQWTYKKLIEAGVAKECARFILPNCTTTIMSFNGSLRSWLTLLNVRCDHHAQKECQDIARAIGEILEIEMPNVFSRINWREGMFM